MGRENHRPMAMQQRPTVVEAKAVSKHFVLRKDKSLKDRILHPGRGKRHEDKFWALRDVSVTVPAGTTVGLIGANGSGKSTLLKIMGGIIETDQGSVCTRGRLAALLELGAGFHPDLTGRENVYLNASILGMSREETDAQFDEILAFSGIEQFIDTQVKFYSSGMYVRLAFSVAIHVNPDILLVDEVLAVGDEAFQEKCLDKIQEFQEQGRTIIIVSHSMGQITSLCDTVVVLDAGRVSYHGDPEEAVNIMRSGLAAREGREGEVSVDVDGTSSTINSGSNAPTKINFVHSTPVGGDVLHPGEELLVEISFTTLELREEWDLTIGLVNSLGATVLVTSTHAVGIANRPIQGDTIVRFKLPNLSLGKGGYSVTATLFDERQRELCRTDGVGVFKVESGDESIGNVYAKVSAELEDAAGTE